MKMNVLLSFRKSFLGYANITENIKGKLLLSFREKMFHFVNVPKHRITDERSINVTWRTFIRNFQENLISQKSENVPC